MYVYVYIFIYTYAHIYINSTIIKSIQSNVSFLYFPSYSSWPLVIQYMLYVCFTSSWIYSMFNVLYHVTVKSAFYLGNVPLNAVPLKGGSCWTTRSVSPGGGRRRRLCFKHVDQSDASSAERVLRNTRLSPNSHDLFQSCSEPANPRCYFTSWPIPCLLGRGGA